MARDESTTVLGSAPVPKWGRTAPVLGNRQAIPLRWASLVVGGVVPLGTLLVLKSGYVADRPARAAIEAIIVMSALTAMFLLYRRFTASRRLRDLFLLGALAAVVAVDATLLVLLALKERSAPVADHTGARLVCEMLVAAALAAAALRPHRIVSGSPRRLVVKVTLATVGVVIAAEALQLLVQGSQTATGRWPSFPGANQLPVAVGVHVVAGAALLFATFAFAKRAPGDRQAAALAVVAELLGVATLISLVSPRIAGAWVTPADAFRLPAALLILALAFREYGGLLRDIERRAISAERARMARDLHDGLAQDLAFIASQSSTLASELGGEHPLTVAARRALDVSRGAIIDLGASSAPSTLSAVETVCRELERRHSIDIDVRLTEGDGSYRNDFDADSREQITRISREAIVNAIKHGRAQRITVELGSRTSERLLTVSDDGRGVGEGPGSAHGLGLGLEMMRARASSLDAQMVLRHRGVGGTELLVLRA